MQVKLVKNILHIATLDDKNKCVKLKINILLKMSKSESKTIKEALKEARDHIDKKDFKSGLKCCKRALNVDKSNYMALVFYGLCSAEVEQFDQAQQVIQCEI